ncbi:hypothetical protein TrST_g14252 [Triparma strigata]|uniref:Sfi1 spindle body domain-containing protein n=1 Tax=Triparma strigata TaxID=1606541 RepID=A0A9W7F4N1_9STRA|nr:hypothetical protein TrST_g14252 [Triparma strigata]
MLSTSLSRDNTSQSSPVQSKSANGGARSREDPTSERRRQKTLSPLRLTKPSPALPHDGTWLTSSSAAWPALNVAASGRELNFEDDPYFTKGFPLGSIFYHFSEEEEVERRRLRNRKCPEDATTYYSRARHFKEVQDRRRFIPPNAFYELLKKNAQTADDLERQARIEQAGQLFLKHAMGALRSNFAEWKEVAAKSKRARRFLKRRFWGIQRSVLIAWCEIAQKYKRGRIFLAKHMGSVERKSFVAWREYTRKSMKVKKFLMGHMAKLEQTVFEMWANYVKKGKYVREKMSRHLVGTKRERFTRWANYARTSAKIRALIGKHFVGVVRTTFVAWFQWAGKIIKAKRMFASQLVGLQKMVFLAWRGVSQDWKRERLQRELYLGIQKPSDYFSSLEQDEGPDHAVQRFPRSYSTPSSRWRMY